MPREAAGALDPEQRRALVASETAQLKAVIGNLDVRSVPCKVRAKVEVVDGSSK